MIHPKSEVKRALDFEHPKTFFQKVDVLNPNRLKDMCRLVSSFCFFWTGFSNKVDLLEGENPSFRNEAVTSFVSHKTFEWAVKVNRPVFDLSLEVKTGVVKESKASEALFFFAQGKMTMNTEKKF